MRLWAEKFLVIYLARFSKITQDSVLILILFANRYIMLSVVMYGLIQDNG